MNPLIFEHIFSWNSSFGKLEVLEKEAQRLKYVKMINHVAGKEEYYKGVTSRKDEEEQNNL